MSDTCENSTDILRNITSYSNIPGEMDTEIRNMIQEPQMQGVYFNSSTNIFDPGISSNSEAGLPCGMDNFLDFMLPQHNFTKADAMKNCGTWVDSQYQLQEARRAKHKRTDYDDGEEEEEEDVDTPDENESERTPSSMTSIHSGTGRRRSKAMRMKDVELELRCEWLNCDHESTHMESFVRHVSLHIPELEVKMTEDDEGVYVCQWQSCGFETTDSKEVVRHVNFHSYHTKIKCIGSKMVSRYRLPACTYDEEGRNLVPDLPEPLICGWGTCERMFNNSQMYFFHVRGHALNNPRGRVVVGGVPCAWRGCKSIFRTTYKLVDHMRTHTQEKVVGCPTCGGLFASKTKFSDHCRRQVPLELQGYQCSHCYKYYPSERLLRDHMRHHVNHYKCSFCDMTCPAPSSLSMHIRFRHLDSKPFKCEYCDYTSKTPYDMKRHANTHCADSLYHCEEDDCDFSCRSAYGLNKHYQKDHQGDDEPLYYCHICDERFYRGAILTRHLFARHSFRWPSGHCRFRYKHDEDGFYRLQTVRYESLKATQEVMQSQSHPPVDPMHSNGRYNLRRKDGGNGEPVSFTLFEDDNDPDDPEEDPGKSGKILISIEELDKDGNVIRRKLMEAEELPSMPLLTY